MFARFAYVEDRPEEDADGDASAASEEPEVARDEIIIQESSPDNDAPAAATSSFFASEPAPPPPDTPAAPAGAAAPAETPADTPADTPDRRRADTPADTPADAQPPIAAAPPAKRHKPLPPLGRRRARRPRNDRPRDAAGGADQYVQSYMAAGASSPANRRFIIVCGGIPPSQTLTGTACKAQSVARRRARRRRRRPRPGVAVGEGGRRRRYQHGEFPCGSGAADRWRGGSRRDRSTQATTKPSSWSRSLTSVKRRRGRVAESTEGYLGYKGVGKGLAGLLRLVNTAPLEGV